jgi:hypothetical protein
MLCSEEILSIILFNLPNYFEYIFAQKWDATCLELQLTANEAGHGSRPAALFTTHVTQDTKFMELLV